MTDPQATPYRAALALRLLRDAASAQGTTERTWADPWTAFINWQTARALERRGLVVIDSEGDIELTEAGKQVAV